MISAECCRGTWLLLRMLEARAWLRCCLQSVYLQGAVRRREARFWARDVRAWRARYLMEFCQEDVPC